MTIASGNMFTSGFLEEAEKREKRRRNPVVVIDAYYRALWKYRKKHRERHKRP